MRKRRQTHVQSLMAQAFYVCLCIYIYIYRESIARQRTEAKIETHASLKARVGSSSNNPQSFFNRQTNLERQHT